MITGWELPYQETRVSLRSPSATLLIEILMPAAAADA
jgi:hypothetical protein